MFTIKTKLNNKWKGFVCWLMTLLFECRTMLILIRIVELSAISWYSQFPLWCMHWLRSNLTLLFGKTVEFFHCLCSYFRILYGKLLGFLVFHNTHLIKFNNELSMRQANCETTLLRDMNSLEFANSTHLRINGQCLSVLNVASATTTIQPFLHFYEDWVHAHWKSFVSTFAISVKLCGIVEYWHMYFS